MEKFGREQVGLRPRGIQGLGSSKERGGWAAGGCRTQTKPLCSCSRGRELCSQLHPSPGRASFKGIPSPRGRGIWFVCVQGEPCSLAAGVITVWLRQRGLSFGRSDSVAAV
jgi:hypothetical protein